MRQLTWKDFGVCLRRARESQGLSQQRLAELLGCQRIHIWRLEHAQRQPSLLLLRALARTCPLALRDETYLMFFEQMAEFHLNEIDVE